MKKAIILLLVFLVIGCSQQRQIGKLGVTSPAVGFEGKLAVKYTCDGERINPPLNIGDIPPEAQSIVLFIEDPDASGFVHWVVWNIPLKNILENSIPGTEGLNSAGKYHYAAPCPPSGTHRYVFDAYAIDTLLNLSQNSTKANVESAMAGHVLARGQLAGLYGRS